MNNEIKKLIKQTGTTTVLLAGSIASCSVGGPLFQNIVGGVLTNILSNKLEQSQLHRLRDILSKRDPGNLNHDIERIIQQAIAWTIKNISFKYEAYCLNDHHKDQLNSIKEKIIDQIRNADKSIWRSSEELLNQINQVTESQDLIQSLLVADAKWPVINEDIPFPQFFNREFISNFQLCFGELLKDKDNYEALVAYNRNVSTQIQKSIRNKHDKIDLILKDNKELKKALSKLSRTPQEQFEKEIVFPEINIALDEYLRPLHDNVQLLVDQNGNILTGIEEIKKEGRIQTQKIENLSRKVEINTKTKNLLILIPFISVALVYFCYKYWQSQQPFMATVSVYHESQSAELPIEETKVILTYKDKTETNTLHQNEVIFKGLPSFVRDDSIRLEVKSIGFHSIDTFVMSKELINLILTRDDSYAIMKGRIKDAQTGKPIPGANVSISANIQASSDNNGYYKLMIPENYQKTEQRVIVSKEGYIPNPWERIEPVIKNTESIIQLTKILDYVPD